jgi:ATP-binding cassette, subfamily C (CFTR/MRP), member 1
VHADDAFGPIVDGHCRGGFDFTLLFEQGILALVPAAIFLLIGPVRVLFLWRDGVKTLSNPVRLGKLVCSVPYNCLDA